MSIKKKANFVLSLGFGFVMGYAGMKYFQMNHQSGSTDFASKSPAYKPLSLGKHHLLTSVRVNGPENMPTENSEEVKLTGYISLHQEIDRPLFWEWHLPEGVQIVSGSLKSYEMSPLAGRTYTTEITVRNFSKADKKIISLQGYVEYDTSRVGNSYAISSDPESSFEYIAPALKAEVDADRAAASTKTE